MPQQLDPQAKALAQAIKQVESGGSPRALGASGEHGSYQFLPATWAKYASEVGINKPLEQATNAEQNFVAYSKIKQWKDKGFTPGQVASMWNAGEGRPDAYKEGHTGTNAMGVQYDTPGYAQKVLTQYQQLKGQESPETGGIPTAHAATQPPPGQAGQDKSLLQKGLEFAFPILEKKERTPLQMVGDVGLSALWFVPGLGAGANLATRLGGGILPRLVGKTAAQGIGRVGAGAGLGYAGDVASGLSQGETASQALKPGVGTVLGGALPPMASAASKALGRAGGEGYGILTGAGYGPLKRGYEAVKAGGEEAATYRAGLRGNVAPEEIVGEARDALQEIVSTRQQGYEQLLSSMRGSTQQLDVSPIFNQFKKQLGNFGVEITPQGLDFSRSVFRFNTQSQQDITKIAGEMADFGLKEGDRTPVGVDRLKRSFSNLYGENRDARAFVEAMRKTTRSILEKVPGYDRGMKLYDETTDAIDEIRKGLSLSDRASVDTAFKKITSALRQNQEFRRVLVGELDKLTGGTLTAKVAGQQLSEWAPKGLMRTVVGGGSLTAIASGMWPALLLAIKTSPRLAGEIVNALGVAGRHADELKNTLVNLSARSSPQEGPLPPQEENPLAGTPPELPKGEGGDPSTQSSGVLPALAMNRNVPNPLTLPKTNTEAEAQLNPFFKNAATFGREVLRPITDPSSIVTPQLESMGVAPALAVGAGIAADLAAPTPGGKGKVFKGFTDLTTKLLEKLKGRTTVSRQFIEDLSNSADLKQAERDLIRRMLPNEKEVSVPDFANRVKSELLPLKRGENFKPSYENISLPPELRGPVADYSERVYKSPIETSAGDVHFAFLPKNEVKNYFAHTRIEDLPYIGKWSSEELADLSPRQVALLKQKDGVANPTRRVIEIQSDLFQKGRLESEGRLPSFKDEGDVRLLEEKVEAARKHLESAKRDPSFTKRMIEDAEDELTDAGIDLQQAKKDVGYRAERQGELAKLEPYRNTWHERVIREEIKQAAKDGKTKLQFPTGETAMKIEGLGQADAWYTTKYDEATQTVVKPERLKVGTQVSRGGSADNWIITDVLGDGKFKAVNDIVAQNNEPAYRYLQKIGKDDDGRFPTLSELKAVLSDKEFKGLMDILNKENVTETFDISGKVDTNNPIYRFYEKEVGKYLKNKYGGKVVTDPQGVKWVEVDVPRGAARAPIEAFAAVPLLAEETNPKSDNKQRQ